MSLRSITTIPPDLKLVRLFEFGVLFGSLPLIAFQLWRLYLKVYDVDFIQFELAVKTWLAGGEVYQPTGSPGWFFFPYPLWTSFLYLPVSFLEHKTAINAWLVLNMLALAPVVWLLQKVFMPGWKALYFAPLYCIALAMSATNLLDGFPNILIVGALALMLWQWQTGRFAWAGAWGGLALVIKPHLTVVPALAFVVWPLVENPFKKREVRGWWLGALGMGLALLAVTWLAQPGWVWRYINHLRVENMTGGVHADGFEYEWIVATFPAWLNYLSGLEGWFLNWVYAGFGLALLGLSVYRLVGWWSYFTESVTLVLTLGLALIPYARPYDYPLLLLPIFYLLAVMWRYYVAGNFGRAAFYGGGVFLTYLMPVFNTDFRWFYWQPLILILLLLSLKPKFR